jgi:hypothetical protein
VPVARDHITNVARPDNATSTPPTTARALGTPAGRATVREGAFVSTSVAPPPWVDRVITIVFLASPSDLTLEVVRLGRCLDSE